MSKCLEFNTTKSLEHYKYCVGLLFTWLIFFPFALTNTLEFFSYTTIQLHISRNIKTAHILNMCHKYLFIVLSEEITASMSSSLWSHLFWLQSNIFCSQREKTGLAKIFTEVEKMSFVSEHCQNRSWMWITINYILKS